MTNDTAPLLTVIVPSYNSQDYLDRSMRTLTGYGPDLEVIIVNDGSKDDTPRLADDWAARFPESVRVIHQANAGHGGALNAGIRAARGTHLKVVDSDDWVDRASMKKVLALLAEVRAHGIELDLLVSNYVYEKQGKARKAVIRYRNVLPEGEIIGWDDVRKCRYDQYLMMHALIFRTELVRSSGLVLPEHTFYVDYLYSFNPIPLVRTIRYLDVDLYRYFIGRDDQSVNEKVMISRMDQLLRVNRGMVEAMPERGSVPDNLYRYMIHYLRINFVVCSIMLLLSGTPEHLEAREKLWTEFERIDPEASAAVRSDALGRAITLPGPVGRAVQKAGYRIARGVLGFN